MPLFTHLWFGNTFRISRELQSVWKMAGKELPDSLPIMLKYSIKISLH